MSTFECPVVQIDKVVPVPNSDQLEMTTVFETNCVIRKGQLKVGDLAVYIPVESMVPMDQPQFKGLGIKSEKPVYRVKAVRLRGTYSEGLLVPLLKIGGFVYGAENAVGTDMSAAWGITKYEEPEVYANISGNGKQQQPEPEIKWAPKYNIEPLVKNRDRIQEGREVQVTEKIHGCNARYAYGPDASGKVRLLVGSHNTWKRPVYGEPKWQLALKAVINWIWSHTVSTEPLFPPPVPTNEDVWWKVAKKLNLEEKLAAAPELVIYGEVYGSVQDLKYSVPTEEGVRFRVFDIYDAKGKNWYNTHQRDVMCQLLGLEQVPDLYRGPYSQSVVDSLRSGKSSLDGATIREGFVIRPTHPDHPHDKQAYKMVSEEYKLRKNGSEFQ